MPGAIALTCTPMFLVRNKSFVKDIGGVRHNQEDNRLSKEPTLTTVTSQSSSRLRILTPCLQVCLQPPFIMKSIRGERALGLVFPRNHPAVRPDRSPTDEVLKTSSSTLIVEPGNHPGNVMRVRLSSLTLCP